MKLTSQATAEAVLIVAIVIVGYIIAIMMIINEADKRKPCRYVDKTVCEKEQR